MTYILKSIVSDITNILFVEDDPSWTQASLPVKFGGLGIRRAVQLALSAFLASAAASSSLINQILPQSLQGTPIPNVDDAMALWSSNHSHPPPDRDVHHLQKSWDTICASATADNLLENAPDAQTRSHLLAYVQLRNLGLG